MLRFILDFRFYFSIFFALITFLILKDIKTEKQQEIAPLFAVESDEQNCFAKEDQDLIWNKLFKNDLIKNPVQLETLSKSSLNLGFTNFNGFLNLSENSAINVKRQKNEIIVDFKKGELFAAYHIQNEKIPLKIKFKKNTLVVNTSDIFLRRYDGNLILSINYGEAELIREDQRIILKSGDIFKETSNDQYIILQPTIKLLTPLNQDHYILVDKDEAKVRVAWKPTQSSSNFHIMVGKGLDDLVPVSKINKSSKHEAYLNFPEGSYYLQVRGAPNIMSDIIKLFVQRQVPVRSVYPSNNEVMTKKNDEDLEVKFQWENPSQFEKLFLEISYDVQFTDLTFHETIQFGNYFLINIKKAGTYFWRINGFPKKSSKLILGETRKLTIE